MVGFLDQLYGDQRFVFILFISYILFMPYKDIETRRERQRKKYKWDKENNPEKLREKERKKYEKNREKIREKRLKSYHKNKEKNREKRNERDRKRYHENIEYRKHRIESAKKRREENPDRFKEIYSKWEREKRKNDPLYKFKKNFTNKLRKSLKSWGGKNTRTINILGLSINDFRIYLETQFESWMSWDNYGLYKKDTFNYGWDIDHIIPTSTAKTKEELCKLNHYTNLKPLCSKVNRDIKRDIM
jgi:hypothetical protein